MYVIVVKKYLYYIYFGIYILSNDFKYVIFLIFFFYIIIKILKLKYTLKLKYRRNTFYLKVLLRKFNDFLY